MNKFELGQEVICKITGLKGVATARVEYINGCIQYAVTPKAEGSKYPDSVYLDQKQLEHAGGVLQMDKESTGGPQINCPSI